MDDRWASEGELRAIADGLRQRQDAQGLQITRLDDRVGSLEVKDAARAQLAADQTTLVNRLLAAAVAVAVIVLGAAGGVILFGPGS